MSETLKIKIGTQLRLVPGHRLGDLVVDVRNQTMTVKSFIHPGYVRLGTPGLTIPMPAHLLDTVNFQDVTPIHVTVGERLQLKDAHEVGDLAEDLGGGPFTASDVTDDGAVRIDTPGASIMIPAVLLTAANFEIVPPRTNKPRANRRGPTPT